MNKLQEIINESTIDNEMIKSQFDEILDTEYGDFELWGSKYRASWIAKKCDPIQYQIKLTDYIDSLEETKEELIEDDVNSEDMPENAANVISDTEIKEEASEEPLKAIQIIKTNFEPEVYLGKDDDKKYYLAVGTLTENSWQPIECVDIREAFKKYNEKIAELQSETLDEDKKAIFEECNKRWAKLHKLAK